MPQTHGEEEYQCRATQYKFVLFPATLVFLDGTITSWLQYLNKSIVNPQIVKV